MRRLRTRSVLAVAIVTIVSVLAGASLLGILGALLAIPTAAAIQIVLRDWWAHRTQQTPAATAADSLTDRPAATSSAPP